MNTPKTYHAFISYSHSDKGYASVIQKSIETLGLPFYKRWKPDVNVFRDERKMPLSGSLTNEIINGLASSQYLIVIASKNSANSKWVKEEILNWHKLNLDEEGFITNFNFILIDDIIEWDYENHDFDRLKTTALPAFEKKIFRSLPVWANLQNYCSKNNIQTNNANYEWEIAKVKALLLNKKPDEIIDEVSKGKRIFRIVASIVIAVLLFLTLFAFNERNKAIRQRDIAVSRELILNAEKNIKSDPQLSLILAINAAKKQLNNESKLSAEMRSSLLRIIKINSKRIPFMVRDDFGAGGVEAFAISPDESKIAIGSQDNTIVVLDMKRYVTLFTLEQDWTVCLKWSSDGKYLASSGHNDESANIWDGVTGKQLKHFEFENTSGVSSVDWRNNTHQIAFAIAMGDNSKVKVYDFDRDSVLFEVSGVRGAWSPDGKKMATGNGNDESWSIRIYNADGTQICQQPGHHRYVHDIAWKPDNSGLATTSVDDQAIIWDAQTCSKVFFINQDFPLCSSWSPDMKYLAVGGGSEVVKIFDVGNQFKLIDSVDYATTLTGDKIDESSIKGYVLNLSWTNDGKNLLLSDRAGSITYIDSRLFGTKTDQVILDMASSLKQRELTDKESEKYLHLKSQGSTLR